LFEDREAGGVLGGDGKRTWKKKKCFGKSKVSDLRTGSTRVAGTEEGRKIG